MRRMPGKIEAHEQRIDFFEQKPPIALWPPLAARVERLRFDRKTCRHRRSPEETPRRRRRRPDFGGEAEKAAELLARGLSRSALLCRRGHRRAALALRLFVG